MAWQTPKTTWENNEVFEVALDYERIRGNINYLHELAEQLYPPFSLDTMADAPATGFPYPNWLNTVVDNTGKLARETLTPSDFLEMARYKGNAPGWDADDLNRIESNHQLLYGIFKGTIELLPKLSFEIGGSEF